MIRTLISKINKSLTRRVVSARHNYEIPIKVSLEPNRNTGQLQMPVQYLTISGETKDLSKTGIAFIVSSIRLREYYLVGEERTLNAELDLPGGKITMQIIGQRYEQVGLHLSETKFLIGATIIKISDDAREIYEHFISHGKKRGKEAFVLGIDKG